MDDMTEEDILDLCQAVEHYKAALESAEGEISLLRGQISELEGGQADLCASDERTRSNATPIKVEELEESLLQLDSEIANMRILLDEKSRECDELRDANNSLEEMLSTRYVDKNERMERVLQSLQSDISKLRAENERQGVQLQHSEEKVYKFQEVTADMQQHIIGLQTEKQELLDQNVSYKAELERYKKERSSMPSGYTTNCPPDTARMDPSSYLQHSSAQAPVQEPNHQRLRRRHTTTYGRADYEQTFAMRQGLFSGSYDSHGSTVNLRTCKHNEQGQYGTAPDVESPLASSATSVDEGRTGGCKHGSSRLLHAIEDDAATQRLHDLSCCSASNEDGLGRDWSISQSGDDDDDDGEWRDGSAGSKGISSRFSIQEHTHPYYPHSPQASSLWQAAVCTGDQVQPFSPTSKTPHSSPPAGRTHRKQRHDRSQSIAPGASGGGEQAMSPFSPEGVHLRPGREHMRRHNSDAIDPPVDSPDSASMSDQVHTPKVSIRTLGGLLGLSKSHSDPSHKFSHPRIQRQHHITVNAALTLASRDNSTGSSAPLQTQQNHGARKQTLRRLHSEDDATKPSERTGWVRLKQRSHPSAIMPTKQLPVSPSSKPSSLSGPSASTRGSLRMERLKYHSGTRAGGAGRGCSSNESNGGCIDDQRSSSGGSCSGCDDCDDIAAAGTSGSSSESQHQCPQYVSEDRASSLTKAKEHSIRGSTESGDGLLSVVDERRPPGVQTASVRVICRSGRSRSGDSISSGLSAPADTYLQVPLPPTHHPSHQHHNRHYRYTKSLSSACDSAATYSTYDPPAEEEDGLGNSRSCLSEREWAQADRSRYHRYRRRGPDDRGGNGVSVPRGLSAIFTGNEELGNNDDTVCLEHSSRSSTCSDVDDDEFETSSVAVEVDRGNDTINHFPMESNVEDMFYMSDYADGEVYFVEGKDSNERSDWRGGGNVAVEYDGSSSIDCYAQSRGSGAPLKYNSEGCKDIHQDGKDRCVYGKQQPGPARPKQVDLRNITINC